MSTVTKTNLNGSSNGGGLAALKNHINTCLQRWQRTYNTKSHEKFKGEYHHQQITSEGKKCSCKFQPNLSKIFFKDSCKECSFVQRTTVYSKSLNTKVLKYIDPQQHLNKDSRTAFNKSGGPRKYGRKVEIVARLLSTTLIAKSKPSSTSETRDEYFRQELQIIQSSPSTSEMTITELNFMELREEYPDLNSEIRSILTARAQEGATISQIRDDYRKLTGIPFPIYEDVTEFLLTIPYVTAYCTEKRTRIFNILPMDKTKHIHKLVMNQKNQPETYQNQKSTPNSNYYRERERNNNYQPLNWRRNTNYRLSQNIGNFAEEPINVRNCEQPEQLIPTTENNLSDEGDEEGFYENNCFYQDNCNYLYNRICNQKQQDPLTSQLMEKAPQILTKRGTIISSNGDTTKALTKFDSDKNDINHHNNLYHVNQFQYRKYQQNIINPGTQYFPLNGYRKPMPVSNGSSSSNAKSWYTNESALTDSDYAAHLLDFLLLGDDFFLYMARMELRCKFKKNQRVLQSGLCVSGQTIGASIKRLKSLDTHRRSIILNIGSVDIMQGRQLIQIEHDFRELITTMLKKGIKPILTTLAPLANYSHNNEIKRMLNRFNDFIKREGEQRELIVIDVWKCLVNEKSHVLFDCYQSEPRNVTGAAESYLFWNKIGRQRVLQLIESQLEY